MATGRWYTSRQMGQLNCASRPLSPPAGPAGGCRCCAEATRLRNIAIPGQVAAAAPYPGREAGVTAATAPLWRHHSAPPCYVTTAGALLVTSYRRAGSPGLWCRPAPPCVRRVRTTPSRRSGILRRCRGRGKSLLTRQGTSPFGPRSHRPEFQGLSESAARTKHRPRCVRPALAPPAQAGKRNADFPQIHCGGRICHVRSYSLQSREQKCVKCAEGRPVVVIRAGDAFCR